MDALDRDILKALAYAGAFPWPLTPVELHQQLDASLGDIMSRLDAMGYASEDIYAMRARQQKECAQKWKLMLRRAWWLQGVPYARALFASGSLALGNVEPESDWDVFVVAQAKRLYTARAGLLLVAWLMGRLRTKRMRTAPDRFCFNHLITTDSLAIKHRSIFVAHVLAELVPVYDPNNFLPRLWHANHWISDHMSCLAGRQAQPKSAAFVRRSIALSRVLSVFRWSVELILNTFIGSLVERGLRSWMQQRIAKEPTTHRPGGRIVANDRELEFHPHSFEVAVLARYNAALVRLGLGQYTEHDSGLTNQ